MIIPMPQLNRDSFEQAAWPHRPALYRLALRMARRPEAAEDLVQDTYLRAYKAFHTFEPGTNLRAWLFQILRHTFINRYRHDRLRPENVEFDAVQEVVEAPDADPESVVMDEILPVEVSRALDELPTAFREAVECAFIHEMTYQETAEQLGVPIGTVMSRIHRGRKLLQDLLHDFAASRRLIPAEAGGRRLVA